MPTRYATRYVTGHSTRLADNEVFSLPDTYIPRLQQFFEELGYRCEEPLPLDKEFIELFHEWLQNELAPMTSWTPKKLEALEFETWTLMECTYPGSSVEKKMLVGKLTAIAILLDDSIDNDELYHELSEFGHRLFMGEPQRSGLPSLYQDALRELSGFYEDPILKGMAVTPWITFVDASLLEKRLMTADPVIRASPQDMGYNLLAQGQARTNTPSASGTSDTSINCLDNATGGREDGEAMMPSWDAASFSLFLRYKSSIGEAYAATIFQANRGQKLPMTRFVRILPDLIFYIGVLNDVISLYKEQRDREDCNFVHLCHDAFCQDLQDRGSFRAWSLSNTIDLICEKVKEAQERIDEELHVAEWEKRMQEGKLPTSVSEEMDFAMAKQWRGYKHGYITWHFDSGRYGLDHLKPAIYQQRFM